MIRIIIIVCSLGTLLGAATLEILCLSRGLMPVRLASTLMTLGCGLLAIRLAYLVGMDDMARLSIWGTFPIFIMAFSRVLTCAALLRKH